MNDERKCERVETVGGTLTFDRSYWPETDTTVPSRPFDLNDLWVDSAPQAENFIAEALISDPPHGHMSFDHDAVTVDVYIWSVGRDCMTLEIDLADTIESNVRVYDKILSKAQADDVVSYLSKLQKVEEALARAKAYLQQQLDEYGYANTSPSE